MDNDITLYLVLQLYRYYLVYRSKDRIRQWQNTKSKWRIQNPSIDGYYTCAVCLQPVNIQQLSYDHIIRAADIKYTDYDYLIFDVNNIQPTHKACNEWRGNVMETPSILIAVRSGEYGLTPKAWTERIIAQALTAYKKYNIPIRPREDIT